jgi:hypothetical protein
MFKKLIFFSLFLYTLTALAIPTVSYEGGRYYVFKDGVQVGNYYNLDTTAKAAAVNASFACGGKCLVIIKQPDIRVITTNPIDTPEVPVVDTPEEPVLEDIRRAIAVSWDIPREREDGTALLEEEIAHYLLMVDNTPIPVIGVNYIVENLAQGTYQLKIATVLKDGTMGAFSETISVAVN